MGSEKLRNIRCYLLRNARYLDIARWNYHFEDQSVREVLKALYAYQNQDGGFGKGIEADIQNPASTPVSTWSALRILREVGFPEDADKMLQRILDYLDHTEDFDGLKWRDAIPSNNDYPHAPWWSYDESNEVTTYNPTAELAGVVIRFAEPNSDLYKKTERLIREMIETATDSSYEMGDHELANFIYFYEDLQIAKRTDLVPENFFDFLKGQVDEKIDRDPALYNPKNYYTSPAFYIQGKDSPYYPGNEEICAFYADYIEQSALPEGYWDLNWNWAEEEVPANVIRDWKGTITVQNMLFLQGMQGPNPFYKEDVEGDE